VFASKPKGVAKSVKSQNTNAMKDNTISSLKSKMKDMAEVLGTKDRELAELK